MKNPQLRLACLLGLMLAVPGMAQAQGWYAGVGVGQTNVDTAAAIAPSAAGSADDSDTAFKVFGGYGFSRNFAVEFGYADLGEFTLSGPGLNMKLESSAIFAELVGRAKVHERVDVFGKLGVAYWDVELQFNAVSGDDNGLDPVVGLGFDFRATDALGIRVEWEQYQNLGEGVDAGGVLELLGASEDVFGIGLTYQF